MSTAARGAELVAALEAAGVPATTDPGAAVPPVVLVTPPHRRYELAVGFTATWRLVALAGGPGGLAAWSDLDRLADAAAAVLPVETVEPTAYGIHPDAPALPAFLLTFTEAMGE